LTEQLLAFDFGSHRIGVAVSRGELVFSRPALSAADSVRAAAKVVVEEGASRVFVGLPLLLSGLEGNSAGLASTFASRLAGQISSPVFLVDERFTTAIADKQLKELPLTGKQRRQIVDSAAAAQLLQFILSSEATNPDQIWRRAGA
jgi:putative Holliday junction resolvase